MFLKGLFYVLMDQATGEGATSGGSGDTAAASGANDGGAGNAAATAASGGEAQASALAQAGGEAHFIPEKYHVKKEDGALDVEASARKLSEAYGHLSKRLGTGDAPPKAPEEYKITVPDTLKDVFDPAKDPAMQSFLKDAHAAGYTQKQIDLAMSRYMDIAPKLVAGSQQLSADECVADLKGQWKTDEQYKAELGKAFKAVTEYGGEDAGALVKDYGNDPRFIRLLNRMGAEMQEDKSLNTGGSLPAGTDIGQLMASDAYMNAKHADHAKVSKQVADYFQAQAAAAERAGKAPLM